MIYYTLVYPHLIYGIILWGSACRIHVNSLFLNQKKLVRAMLNADYYAHTHPIFIHLNLLKVDDIYRVEILKFMYHYANGNLPISLSNIFTYTSCIHSYNTRQAKHIRPYNPRTNTSQNSLLFKGPKLWNDLPTLYQNKCTIKSFASTLRIDTIQQYRDQAC